MRRTSRIRWDLWTLRGAGDLYALDPAIKLSVRRAFFLGVAVIAYGFFFLPLLGDLVGATSFVFGVLLLGQAAYARYSRHPGAVRVIAYMLGAFGLWNIGVGFAYGEDQGLLFFLGALGVVKLQSAASVWKAWRNYVDLKARVDPDALRHTQRAVADLAWDDGAIKIDDWRIRFVDDLVFAVRFKRSLWSGGRNNHQAARVIWTHRDEIRVNTFSEHTVKGVRGVNTSIVLGENDIASAILRPEVLERLRMKG